MVDPEVVVKEYERFADEISMKIGEVGCAVSLLGAVENLMENIPDENSAAVRKTASESLFAAKRYLNLVYEELSDIEGKAFLKQFD